MRPPLRHRIMISRAFRKALFWCSLGVGLMAGGAQTIAEESASKQPDPVTRRLGADQYRQIVADIFGDGLEIGGRFEPDAREDGLLAIGRGRVSVTTTGLEQYEAMARTIARQVMSEPRRSTLMPCVPASAQQADESCARQFLGSAGALLFRRLLSEQELGRHVDVARAAATAKKDFYAGIEISLANLLVSPYFLFRQEFVEPDPTRPGQYRLDGYSKASRISFLLWNTAPDRRLLDAAARGDLHAKKNLAAEVARLANSPRLVAGVRAFFTDMLGFEKFETLAKDATIYPKFTVQAAQEAQEQTLRTIADLVVTQRGDYRDIFTTRKTFLTRSLGSIYEIPVVEDSLNDEPSGWTEYVAPADDPRVGILSHVSFTALHSHPGRSSPTLRGKALREMLLCQKVPDPPGNVDFSVVQDTANPNFKTTRQRLQAHATEAMCVGCHKLIDPMGLALETFDAVGSYRVAENGVAIDTSGQLEGVSFADARQLGKAVRDNPASSACVVNRLFSYATGRPISAAERALLSKIERSFAAGGHQIPKLLIEIATSDEFYQVAQPKFDVAARTAN